MAVMAVHMPMGQPGQQHEQARHDQDGMRRQGRNLRRRDQRGNESRRDQQQTQARTPVVMAMPVMMVVAVAMSPAVAAMAAFAGGAFVQREIVAHPDIDFAHSIFSSKRGLAGRTFKIINISSKIKSLVAARFEFSAVYI
jgi:hypothetical protein